MLVKDIATLILVLALIFALFFIAVEITYLLSTFVARRRARRSK